MEIYVESMTIINVIKKTCTYQNANTHKIIMEIDMGM